MAKDMSYEEKQKLFEEQQFKKRWAKHLKLSPMFCKISNEVGKGPRCNTKGPKKEVSVIVDTKNKKKK